MEQLRRRVPLAVLVGAALTALVSVVLSARIVPLGVLGEWVWPYWPADLALPALPLAWGPAVLLGLLAWVALRATERGQMRDWQTAVTVAGATVLHAGLLMVAVPATTSPGGAYLPAPVRMGALVASPTAFGYYVLARDAGDAATLLATHEGRMADPATPERVRTHPPGPGLVYLAVNSAFDSLPYTAVRTLDGFLALDRMSDDALVATVQGPFSLGLGGHEARGAIFCGYATAILAALVIVPVFLLAREVGGLRVGLAAACIYGVTPSALVFVPAIDPWVTALAAACLWLTVLAARKGSIALAAGAGAVIWAALQISFGAIALVPIAGIVLLLLEGRQLRRAAALLAALVAVPVALSLIVWPLTSYNAFHAFVLSRAAHAGVTARRTYLPWIGGDLLDLAFGFGVCATACLVATARTMVARRPTRTDTSPPPPLHSGDANNPGTPPPPRPHPATALLIAALATLLLVDLSGTVRGEVARIWQFLMPLLLVPAVVWLDRGSSRLTVAVVIVFAFQFLQAFAMQANAAFMVPW